MTQLGDITIQGAPLYLVESRVHLSNSEKARNATLRRTDRESQRKLESWAQPDSQAPSYSQAIPIAYWLPIDIPPPPCVWPGRWGECKQAIDRI